VRLPIVVLIIVLTYCSMLVPPAWSHSSSADTSPLDTQQGTASEASMGAASAAAIILYFPFKAAFAIAGVLAGGLAYVFSGFSEPTAKSIWIPVRSVPTSLLRNISLAIVRYVSWALQPKVRGCQPPRGDK
jgi:hypothetical protein